MSDGQELSHYELVGLGGAADAQCEPPDGIEIRSAVELDDLSVIAELYNAAFELLDDGVTEAEIAGYARHPGLAAPGVFLAFDDALAVGIVVGRLDVPAPGGDARRAGVELLAVRPEYRRRGIGAALMGRLLAWLAANGIEMVGATVRMEAAAPGLGALIERYGFRQVGK